MHRRTPQRKMKSENTKTKAKQGQIVSTCLPLFVIFISSILFSLLWGCSPSRHEGEGEREKRLSIDTTHARIGDLLFRCGTGGESRLVTSLSQSTYSHIGILWHDTLSGWQVIHAVPGEAPNGEEDYLKCESISDFLTPQRAIRVLHAQVSCNDSVAQSAALFALDKVLKLFCFDHDYRLNDERQYYCTELIYRAYLKQGIDLVEGRFHSLPLPTAERDFIFPSDILESPYLSIISQDQH